MKDIFVGRQAIYDNKMEIFAYELLFRAGMHNTSNVPQASDGDLASSEVLLNTFMEIGLDQVAGPHLVFVNLTRNLLLDHPRLPFDRERVVMELLENTPVDQRLITAIQDLSLQGYRLALDDYTFEPTWDPLLPFVHFVKLDIPSLSMETIRQGIPKLHAHGLKLLAEKIESEEEYQQLREMGFDYYQGYYFSHPKVIRGKRLDENQAILMQLISHLNDPQVTIEQLEKLVTQDASLSYKILRYINSTAFNLAKPVTSIRQAVIHMGLARIRAWASLLALTQKETKPQTYFTTALVRAHMCEQLVSRSGQCPPETGFTVGLLSILDLLMDRPLAEIVDELALSEQIREALLQRTGIAGKALRCSLAYEEQDWLAAQFDCVSDEEIVKIYLDASQKAFAEEQALASV